MQLEHIQSIIPISIDDIKEIPLYNDLISTYPDLNLNNFFDINNLQTHIILNNENYNLNYKITISNLRDYIKFIDFTTLPVLYYEKIVKYINTENIHEIVDLFKNDDIKDNLFYLLNFDIKLEIIDNTLIKPIKQKIINEYYIKINNILNIKNNVYFLSLDINNDSLYSIYYHHNMNKYFEYLNKNINNNIIDNIIKFYATNLLLYGIKTNNKEIINNVIKFSEIHYMSDYILINSVKNKSILKIILDYNNINKINEEDYEYYKKNEPDTHIEAIINYGTIDGLNKIIKWIIHFDISNDNNDYYITWFTEDNIFYGKIFSK